ncbi:IS110 family transposase [Bacteroides sp. 519]|nr:IS110 family transposase [Bacteroides sp. 519]
MWEIPLFIYLIMIMKTGVIKQVVGIDISKDDFQVCFSVLTDNLDVKIRASRKFKNTQDGFDSFCDWFSSKQTADLPIAFTMEATGVYYEGLAYFLYNKGFTVHVILPNQVKKYGQSLGVKSKTDSIDAAVLARMGLERKLSPWKPFSPNLQLLKQLCRERDRLIAERTTIKNHLHSYSHQGVLPKDSIKRCQKQIAFLNKLLTQVEKQIEGVVQKDTALHQRLKHVQTIKGVAFWTAIIIISETNGFATFHSIKQLTSYAGLDIRIAESGKWKGKSKISKQGNSYIRKALYFPAFCMAKHDPHTQQYYQKLRLKKGVTMIAAVAVQRKILALIYTLWKKQEDFKPQM